ncbi:MAG: DUF3160 domain-containing protein [Candidatus Limnocylindrales bacterium]
MITHRSPRMALPSSLVLVVALCAPVAAADPDTSPVPGSSGAPAAATLPGGDATFGSYNLVPLSSDDQPYQGPRTPHSLRGVSMGDDVEALLEDPAVRQVLRRQGFVIVPSDMPRFSAAYESQPYTSTPVFVTTDAIYDAWHLVFDRVLRGIETQRLLPRLEDLVTGMLANARAQATELQGTTLADPAQRVVTLLQVAGRQLGLKVGTLDAIGRAELALIKAHDELTRSPLLGTDIDYSLYTPRGHYTRTRALTRYFLGMSVLGQTAFALPGALQDDLTRADASGLRLAALAARTLVGDEDLEQLWRDIYEPTAFLVGLSDDYTPFELATAIESAQPGAMADPAPLAEDGTIASVADVLTAARPIRIDSERPAVRLMGTRFVVDSFVLDQLLAPNVGTPAEPRLLPSPLDLAAAFGSDFAYAIQRDAGETDYLHYDDQMAAMRGAISARPDEAWGSTVYDAWLAAIEPMWLPHGTAFPDFMQSDAWTAKDHQSGFGSYAELKHDTILYTKQSVGEMGDSGPAEMPRNWVEPDPVPFLRLQAMADLEREGLRARGLLNPRLRGLLTDFSDLAGFLARIAADELAGEPISKTDNERLLYVGGVLEDLWWRTSDTRPGSIPTPDDPSAIIADIASGRDRATDTITVVEVATGHVDQLLVLVPDDKGRFHVALGGVYSYYEFLQPISDRLTDEAWHSMLDAGEVPPRPDWIGPTMR